MKKFNLEGEKIVIIRNAVDVAEFALDMTKEDARTKLNLEQNKTYVVYTGHLYSWKGVDTLALAARLLPEGVDVLFVGGREDDIKRFSEKYNHVKNIRLVGFRPHEEIPLWQCAADVLVLPNTAKEEISSHYTSPMKLFEYMASGRPIVASRIPSISEILDDLTAILCAPDDVDALAEGIIQALSEKGLRCAEKAKSAILEFTWEKRAKKVLLEL